MLKEIMEQPECIVDTFRGAIVRARRNRTRDLTSAMTCFGASRASCSSAWARACTPPSSARTYFERIAGIPAEVDNSSEFRYRDSLIGPDTLVISVAQSGETVDTLEAMADAKRRGAPQITICNTPGAQTTRVADGAVLTRCGPEVAVASTKTLTASITAIYLLACHVGRVRGAWTTLSPRC
jgi:glucosamine--fructose-6-phosphate aminotransferase (isomerizing)